VLAAQGAKGRSRQTGPEPPVYCRTRLLRRRERYRGIRHPGRAHENGQGLAAGLPPPLVAEALRLYLTAYRAPHVRAWRRKEAREDHGAVWIAKGGGPAHPGTMAAAMKAATRGTLGYAVSPHRLRDSAATYIGEEMPEQAALVSVVLQPSNSATTREYTRQAGQVAAFRTIAAHLAADAVAAERRTRATTRSLGCSRAPRGGAPRCRPR